MLVVSVLAALPLLWPGAPRAAVPADGWVIWQSSRMEARTDTYRSRADGSDVMRLTEGGTVRALWAPDGRWIAYGDEVGGVWVIRPDGTERKQLTDHGYLVVWQHDNGGVLVEEGTQFLVMDPETNGHRLMFDQNEFPAFQGTTFQVNALTHDNRYMLLGSHLYSAGFTGANGSFKTGAYSAVIVDLLDKQKVYLLGAGCWPFTPPRGDLVFHICADCPGYPDIYRMDLADLATRASYKPEVSHPDADWGHEYNPRVSNDNHWIAYMTSTGCHDGLSCDYEIFLHALDEEPNNRYRVTNDPAFDGYPDVYVGPMWQKTETPRLLVTPSRSTFFATAASMQPATIAVQIKNDGGGSLGELTIGQPSARWLEVTRADTTLTLRARAEGLVRGRQQATFTIAAAGGTPHTFEVTTVADDSFPVNAAAPDAGVPSQGTEDAGTVAPPPPSDDGCSCALGRSQRNSDSPRPAAGGSAALGLLALGALWITARSRRSRRGPPGCSSPTAARPRP